MDKRMFVLLLVGLTNLVEGSACARNSILSRTPAHICKPKSDVAFVKTHKCASSTVGNILIRRGLRRNLKFALPKYDDAHIGWPDPLVKDHILLPSDGQVNMLVHHTVYNRTTLKAIMPKDTVYITILREPFSQFKSVMSFFDEIAQLGFKTKDWVYEFLSNPYKYEKPLTLRYGSRIRERSVTRNFLSSEFGLTDEQDEFAGSPASIQAVIDGFDLVMIREYFYESVVLLRRLMCWELKDMLFMNLNEHIYERPAFEERQKELHREWSTMDHALYEYANYSFWNKIDQQNNDFYDEVIHFRKINKRVQQFCQQALNNNLFKQTRLNVEETRWNEEFLIDIDLCEDMSKKPAHLYDRIVRSMYSITNRIWIALYYGFLGFL